jgi:hypothetical protein
MQEDLIKTMIVDNGFGMVGPYGSSWSVLEAIFEHRPDIRGVWHQNISGAELDSFLVTGYTLVAGIENVIGEKIVVMTKDKFNYLKGKRNG